MLKEGSQFFLEGGRGYCCLADTGNATKGLACAVLSGRLVGKFMQAGSQLTVAIDCLPCLCCQGVNVRVRAKELLQLVNDPDKVREERNKVRGSMEEWY